jgi:hypothetical protein
MSVSRSPVDFAREIWPEKRSKTPEKHPNFAKLGRKKREIALEMRKKMAQKGLKALK